jgi:hypothetical protein
MPGGKATGAADCAGASKDIPGGSFVCGGMGYFLVAGAICFQFFKSAESPPVNCHLLPS